MTDKQKILQMAASPDVDAKLNAYMMGVVVGLVSWEEYFRAAFELMEEGELLYSKYQLTFCKTFEVRCFFFHSNHAPKGAIKLALDVWKGHTFFDIFHNRYNELEGENRIQEAKQAIETNLSQIQSHFCDYFKLPKLELI